MLSPRSLVLAGLATLAMLYGWSPGSAQTVYANGIPVWPESEAEGSDAVGPDAADLTQLLAAAGRARVVHLVGDAEGHEELIHQAQLRLIRLLRERAGYSVLVIPAGIFEGAWTDTRLREGAPVEQAASPLYRVWRESPAFLDLLRYIGEAQRDDAEFELIGGLSRFHATGKALYAPHLIAFFDEVRSGLLGSEVESGIETYWGGRARLARASAEDRTRALRLAAEVLKRFDEARPLLAEAYGAQRIDLERHFVVNMGAFVELERRRRGHRAA